MTGCFLLFVYRNNNNKKKKFLFGKKTSLAVFLRFCVSAVIHLRIHLDLLLAWAAAHIHFSCTSSDLVICVLGTFEVFPFLFISLDFLRLPASLPLLPFPKSQKALFSSDPSDPSTFPDRILQFECCHFPFHHFVPWSGSALWPAHLLWNGIWPFLSASLTDFLLTTLSLPAPPVAESLPVSRV